MLSGSKRKAEHEAEHEAELKAELKFEGEALLQIEKKLKDQSPEFSLSLSPLPSPMLSSEAECWLMTYREEVRMQRDEATIRRVLRDMAEIESQRQAELLAEKEEKDKAEDERFPKSCISCIWPMSDSCSNPVCERKFVSESKFEFKSEPDLCDLCDKPLSEGPCCRLVVV